MIFKKFLLKIFKIIFLSIVKHKIVNSKNGKKATLNEFLIDIFSLLLYDIAVSIIFSKNNPDIYLKLMLIFFVNGSMLITYLIDLHERKFNYLNRKFYSLAISTIVMLIIFAIIIIEMIFGIYDVKTSNLSSCFFTSASYFFVSLYFSLTSETIGRKQKIFVLINKFKLAFKNYKMSDTEYFTVAFLTLLSFNDYYGYTPQIPIFGIQEIINKKSIRGFLFIGLGVFTIILTKFYPQISSLLTVCYDVIALVYLMFVFVHKKYRNNNNNNI